MDSMNTMFNIEKLDGKDVQKYLKKLGSFNLVQVLIHESMDKINGEDVVTQRLMKINQLAKIDNHKLPGKIAQTVIHWCKAGGKHYRNWSIGQEGMEGNIVGRKKTSLPSLFDLQQNDVEVANCSATNALLFRVGQQLVIITNSLLNRHLALKRDSFIIDGSVNLKPSVTELNAINDEAFIVDKKYVNFTDLNLVSDEKVSISDKDDLEKKDVYGSGAKTSDAVDVVIKEVESDNVDVNMNEVIADEDVDLDGNNVFITNKKSFLGDEDVDFCEKNYVVSEQKMFIGDEDVEFAQNNYVVLNCSDYKRDESSDADMNNCTDIPKFGANADSNDVSDSK
ncbi:hypothetical protein Tco_1014671 [Tanacetum coccineum]